MGDKNRGNVICSINGQDFSEILTYADFGGKGAENGIANMDAHFEGRLILPKMSRKKLVKKIMASKVGRNAANKFADTVLCEFGQYKKWIYLLLFYGFSQST